MIVIFINSQMMQVTHRHLEISQLLKIIFNHIMRIFNIIILYYFCEIWSIIIFCVYMMPKTFCIIIVNWAGLLQFIVHVAKSVL